jgi:ribosomal protein S27AE
LRSYVVAMTSKVEEEFRSCPACGDVVELVEDEKFELRKLLT